MQSDLKIYFALSLYIWYIFQVENHFTLTNSSFGANRGRNSICANSSSSSCGLKISCEEYDWTSLGVTYIGTRAANL